MIVSLLLSLARGRKRRRATPTYLIVSPTSHDFGMNTGSVEIVVDSSSDWTATGVPSDMALSATSGSAGTATIYLTRTNTSLGGTATITFTNSDGETATFAVTRTATYLTLSLSSYDFGTSSTGTSFTVRSSSAWTASGVPSDMSLSATSGSAGETNVTLSRTDYDLDGTAVITFKNENGDEATLSVTRTKVSVAVLVNASDSSDIHEFESCEAAATYATENSDTNWELTIKSGTVPLSCFSNLTNLVALTLEEGVTSIGDYAFFGCSGLTGALTIPASVTSIGNYAFYYCLGLTSLTLNEGVQTIGDYAFRECSGLTGALTIPASVTSIGDYAFNNCWGLTGALTIPASVTSIGVSAFYYCSGLTSLTLNEGLQTIGNYAFRECSGLTGALTIPASVTSIGDYAFRNCSGLTSLTLNEGVTSIGNYAFYYCSGLTGALTIPASVTSIGNYAFRSCSGFDDDLTYYGTSNPSSSTTVFNSTNFTVCKVPSDYEDDNFCDLPVEKGAVSS